MRAISCWVTCGLLLVASGGCSGLEDVVFRTVEVGFAASNSSASEHEPVAQVQLVLSAATDRPVIVTLSVTDVTASGHDDCGTRDYSAPDQIVRFAPGETTATIEIRQLDDAMGEPDEELRLRITDADGAGIASRSEHSHVIVDDDRSLLADVRADFGALGDGRTDDTQAVQQAIDRAARISGAVVFFPPGVYVVRTLQLAAGVNYFGYGATITRAANQPTDMRSLQLQYSGSEDTEPVVIQGITIDGNRDQQAGSFTGWEYRDADLLLITGDPALPGKVHFVAEDITLQNTGASGLLVETNADGTVCRLKGNEVFTDLVHLLGGNSALRMRGIIAQGEIGTTGMALRSSNAGFDGQYTVEIEMEDVELHSGDLTLSLDNDSVATLRNVSVLKAPIYLRAVRSRIDVSDSLFYVGPALRDYNRVVAPGDVTFRRSRFVLTETPDPTRALPEQDRELRAIDLVWNDVQFAQNDDDLDLLRETLDDQTLSFEDCAFEIAGDVESTDDTYAIGTRVTETYPATSSEGTNNHVVVRNCTVSGDYDGTFAQRCTGCEVQ